MGRVWLAHDEMLGRDVAIKEVAPPAHLFPDDDEHLRAVILREAKAAGRINHPNVVKIHDVIETQGWPWLVMEYVRSVNLYRAVEEQGPLPPTEVARIGLAVLEALVAAHNAGVLHRDVKPANVLLGDDGRVVLGDFGLATIDPDGKVTLTGALGTPQFLAPERARHGTSSREADLWSLGATLYAAVEGHSPYARDTMLDTLKALATEDPDPMRLAGPLKPVLAGLLRREPAERTRPELLARQLRNVVDGQTVEKPDAPRRTARTKQAILAGVAAAALGVAVAIVLNSQDRGPTTPFAGVPAAGGRPVPAIGIPGCETLREQASPLPQASSSPDGWVLHADPAGFSVPVPPRWAYWRLASNTVCFRDPGGNRVMGVMATRPKAESLQGYREIAQKEVSLRQKATEWEFTYTLQDRKRHAIVLVMPGRAVFWITDDTDFAASRAQYDFVRTHFDAG